MYVKDFGENKGDWCFVAQVKDEIVGAVWVCLLKEYRNCGIGTELMKQILVKLKMQGHARESLPV